jgi:hypothetical protein
MIGAFFIHLIKKTWLHRSATIIQIQRNVNSCETLDLQASSCQATDGSACPGYAKEGKDYKSSGWHSVAPAGGSFWQRMLWGTGSRGRGQRV